METSSYAPNSHKYKSESSLDRTTDVPEKKKVEKVIKGTAVAKKPGFMKRFAGKFLSEDVDDVGSYILMDVLVPAVKAAISDVVSTGIDMLLYGEARGPRKGNGSSSRVSYSSFYDSKSKPRQVRSMSDRYECQEIILADRGEAELVLDRLIDIIDEYHMASVSDLYDMVDVSGNYTDQYWGWFDLSNSQVQRVREGYLLKLPRPVSLR